MSPFGPMNHLSLNAKKALSQMITFADDDSRIHFSPQRQVLHGPTSFSITIEDEEGVPEDFELSVLFNGDEVGPEFLRQAKRTYLDPLRRQVRLSTKHLRLLPEKENVIYVSYKRTPASAAVVSQYQPPTCSAFETVRELSSLPDFSPNPKVLKAINRYSGERQFNPYFVAGLIAQESSFDPRALSSGRALGLTQITSLGEGEVIKRFQDWPRNPAVADMSLPMLRLAILRGQVHSGNEWRLNPDLSIRGGVEYLSYISDYWNKTDKRAQIFKSLGDSDLALSEVMLASYNSGPARVSEALERRGPDWLRDQELNEARKYVRRVNSYCEHFNEAPLGKEQ